MNKHSFGLLILLLLCTTHAACASTPRSKETQTPQVLSTVTAVPLYFQLQTPTRLPFPTETTSLTPVSTIDTNKTTTAMPDYLFDLTFTDTLHGWLAGFYDKTAVDNALRLALASSIDGGKTWQPVPLPDIIANNSANARNSIFFKDNTTGWVYYNGLISTTDAGQHWTAERPLGKITQMSRAANGIIWALEKTGSSWQVWNVVDPDYSRWTPLIKNFPIDPDFLSLTLSDANHAWIMQYYGLQSTQDGGESWHSQPSPCNRYGGFGGAIQAAGSTSLWLGCGGKGGSGMGGKFIFTSSDGGQTWQLHGKAEVHPPHPSPDPDNLPSLGYFNNIQALSPTFAYMTWMRSHQMGITKDGGVTWELPLLPCVIDNLQAFFIDPLHGWAIDQDCVNRTTDGGKTWDCTPLPGSQSCPSTNGTK